MTHEVLSQFLSLQLKSTFNQTKMSDSHSPAQTPHFSTFFVGASIFSLHFKHSAYGIIFVLNCFSFFLLTNFVWWWKLRAISLNKLNFIVFFIFRFEEKRTEMFIVHLEIQLNDINVKSERLAVLKSLLPLFVQCINNNVLYKNPATIWTVAFCFILYAMRKICKVTKLMTKAI